MKYLMGIDFGTLSARAVVVDVTGKEISSATYSYPHAVMTSRNGVDLPNGYALQNPNDYLEALSYVSSESIRRAGVDNSDIVGVGVDFTSSTVLAVDETDTPLCNKDEFSKNPHAYAKLWKHHGAEGYATIMENLATERDEKWLKRYGGKLSCEFALCKIVETLKEAPDVYNATARFVEGGDWIASKLTGKKVHSCVFCGYKWCWSDSFGYPSNEYFMAVDERLNGVVGSKIPEKVDGEIKQGVISTEGAILTGLKEGTPVSMPIIDAHVALPAVGVVDEGDLMLIIGTSGCQILHSKKEVDIEGVFGYVKDGIVNGLYTYEAGQSAVGDIFEWVVNTCVSNSYKEEAKSRGVNIHKLLREKAKKLKVGQSGLIALDWLNGNRSILQNPRLKGAIYGLTLNTKPEEIYRAFIEATAFGVRVILDSFYKAGIKIDRIVAGGGIAVKDDMLMQIYADVLNKPIEIAPTTQAGALGSAIYGAVAGGLYPDIESASKAMAGKSNLIYTPNPDDVKAYEVLYNEYKSLHDYFGKNR